MKHSKGFAKPKSNNNPSIEARQRFSLAVQYQQANQLAQAEAAYRKILDLQPDHLDALHNLGIVLGTLGNLSEAEVQLRKAAALQPNVAHIHYNLGNNWRLRETGRKRKRATEERLSVNQTWPKPTTTWATLYRPWNGSTKPKPHFVGPLP